MEIPKKRKLGVMWQVVARHAAIIEVPEEVAEEALAIAALESDIETSAIGEKLLYGEDLGNALCEIEGEDTEQQDLERSVTDVWEPSFLELSDAERVGLVVSFMPTPATIGGEH